MKKSHIEAYPEKNQKQVTFANAVMSMLNARRYLQSEGFIEKDCHKEYACIAGGYGHVSLPDVGIISHDDFMVAKNKDNLLESMVERNGIFVKREYGYDNVERKRVIQCSFQLGDYQSVLLVTDTTKLKKPITGLFCKPLLFAFTYQLLLTKEIISDENLKQFQEIVTGLNQVIKEYTPQTYTPKPLEVKYSQPEAVQPVQINIINPWEITIPRVGDTK